MSLPPLDDVTRGRILGCLRVEPDDSLEPDTWAFFEEVEAELFEYVNRFDPEQTYAFLHDMWRFPPEEAGEWVSGQAFKAILHLQGRDPSLFLGKVLKHPDTAWRCAACEALGNLRGPMVVHLLCHTLLNDTDEDVRFNAAQALQLAGDDEALPALEHAAVFDDGRDYEGWAISTAAREAMAAIERRRRMS